MPHSMPHTTTEEDLLLCTDWFLFLNMPARMSFCMPDSASFCMLAGSFCMETGSFFCMPVMALGPVSTQKASAKEGPGYHMKKDWPGRRPQLHQHEIRPSSVVICGGMEDVAVGKAGQWG